MHKKYLLLGFSLIAALEGFWAFVSIWRLPPSSTPVFLGQSLTLLVLLVLIDLVTLAFLCLAFCAYRRYSSWIEQLLRRRFSLLIAFGLVATGLVLFYLVALSPLRIARLHAYTLRFQALLIWSILLVGQFFLLALFWHGPGYWRTALADLSAHPTWQRNIRPLSGPPGGLVLLAASLLIGYFKLYYGRFVDEADNLVVGWLLTEGYTLYRDIFSHHFPFSYYWVAAVVSLFGRSFAAARFSILALQVGLFGLGMRLTRWYLPFGLASLLWNLTSHFRRGQQVLYTNLEGLFLAVAGVLVLALLLRRLQARPVPLALIGLLTGLAVLADPLMVYPAAVVLLGVFLSGVTGPQKPGLRPGFRRLIWSGLPLLILGALFFGNLLVRGTLDEFYRSTIWFNANIYAKYVDASPNRLGQLLSELLQGFKVWQPGWYRYLSPTLPLETYGSVKLDAASGYGAWLFGPVLIRWTLLLAVSGWLLSRRYAAAAFAYIFAAALLVRAETGFYANGFTLFSLLLFGSMLTEPGLFLPRRDHNRSGATRRALLPSLWVGLLLLLAGMQFWSGLRGAQFMLVNRFEITNKRHVRLYEQWEAEVRDLTCDPDDLKIGVYPINPLAYFVTGLHPVSKYTWVYPWVAEVAQDELIADLGEGQNTLVWINIERGEDENAVRAYMAPTVEFLDREYIKLSPEYWVSPDLAAGCPVQSNPLPLGAE